MRIGIWCTTHRSIPPQKYGGVQLINWITAEALVEAGYDVIVFSNKDSKTKASLIPMPKGSGEEHEESLAKTYEDNIKSCDVLIDTSTFSYPGRLYPDLRYLIRTGGDCNRRYCRYWTRNIVFPSLDQRTHHSVDCACAKQRKGKKRRQPPILRKPVGYWLYSRKISDFDKFSASPENRSKAYYLYMGSIEPIKGVHLACEFAVKTGITLVIVGPIKDAQYYKTKIEPMELRYSNITYMGELNSSGSEKWVMLGCAKALVYPTNCHDADPNVPKESLIVKTPVIGLANGALPEIVSDRSTGVLCLSVDEMVSRIGELNDIDPEQCRKEVLEKFSVESYTENLVAICKNVAGGEIWY